MPPPYLVRRIVVAPLFILGTVLLIGAMPLWLLVAAFASRYVPGRWRMLRVSWFFFLYLVLESLMLVVLFGLWVASGFGWHIRSVKFQGIHYRVAAWWLRRVMGSARFTFNLNITRENPVDAMPPTTPLLVFSRHAGPGDSFLLVDALLNGPQSLRPRIILKDLLRLDPCVDVVLGRLPNRFIPSSGRAGQAVIDSIADLAGTMSAGDAFVLFPEGGNFTDRRQERAIHKLEESGRGKLADRAREMQHLLPPKPGGALTAIEAAPDADIIFVGHVGLEQLSSLRSLWRGIPLDADIVSRVWRIDSESIPPPEDQERWLYDQWQTIDDWIDARIGSG